MAKVLSDRIAHAIPVWTVESLLSCNSAQDCGVDSTTFYDNEAGLSAKVGPCRKVAPCPRKQNSWSENCSYAKKQCDGKLLFWLGAIAVLFTVLVTVVTTVICLAAGEIRMTWQEDKQPIRDDEGIYLVEGEIVITNRMFTKDLLNPYSEAYRKLSFYVQQSMDAVFIPSLKSYNRTKVTSFRKGSVIAQFNIYFSEPRLDVTNEVGMAVIQALEKHHGYLPGGILQVDIRSLQFTGLPGVSTPDPPEVLRFPEINTVKSEIKECAGNCQDGQICIFLSHSSFSRCVIPKDPKDPTGCGGWCSSKNELCRRLGNSTYQCAENEAACKDGEWQCDNGLCVHEEAFCNGKIECYDMSDEMHCECGKGHFRCGNTTPCLPRSLKCDGKVDCWDASDEVNCSKSCPKDKFTCNNGKCIEVALFCDRYPDCLDGSDEPEGCNEPCLSTQKQCNNGRCISAMAWCNGVDNCKDGSDETGCDAYSFI